MMGAGGFASTLPVLAFLKMEADRLAQKEHMLRTYGSLDHYERREDDERRAEAAALLREPIP